MSRGNMRMNLKDERTGFLVIVFLAALLFWCALTALAHASDADCETPTHCVLQSLARHTSDIKEDEQSRSVRMRGIANAIDGATTDRVERAWLVMTAREESHYAKYVEEDAEKCSSVKTATCDHGRAWGLWQVHTQDRTGGSERAAKLAIEKFRRAANYCVSQGFDRWLGGTSQYARGGRHCEWSESRERVSEMWKIWGRLK